MINCFLGMLTDSATGSKKFGYLNSYFYSKLNGSNGYDYSAVMKWPKSRKLDFYSGILNSLLLPIHVSGNHWILCLVDLDGKSIHCFDPYGTNHHNITTCLERFFQDDYHNFGGGGDGPSICWKHHPSATKESSLPIQTNSVDCGIYILVYAYVIFHRLKVLHI